MKVFSFIIIKNSNLEVIYLNNIEKSSFVTARVLKSTKFIRDVEIKTIKRMSTIKLTFKESQKSQIPNCFETQKLLSPFFESFNFLRAFKFWESLFCF